MIGREREVVAPPGDDRGRCGAADHAGRPRRGGEVPAGPPRRPGAGRGVRGADRRGSTSIRSTIPACCSPRWARSWASARARARTSSTSSADGARATVARWSCSIPWTGSRRRRGLLRPPPAGAGADDRRHRPRADRRPRGDGRDDRAARGAHPGRRVRGDRVDAGGRAVHRPAGARPPRPRAHRPDAHRPSPTSSARSTGCRSRSSWRRPRAGHRPASAARPPVGVDLGARGRRPVVVQPPEHAPRDDGPHRRAAPEPVARMRRRLAVIAAPFYLDTAEAGPRRWRASWPRADRHRGGRRAARARRGVAAPPGGSP